MNRLFYLSGARLPTEKAHGVQTMKMCEAFAEHLPEVTLLHPHRIQPAGMPHDAFEYHGVPRNFTMEALHGVDGIRWATAHSQRLLSVGAVATDLVHAINVAWRTRPSWREQATVYFSRHAASAALLLRFRGRIRGPIVYEAHTFPETLPRLVTRVLSSADAWIVMTGELGRMYSEAGIPADAIHVEPDAVDLDAFGNLPDMRTCRKQLGLPVARPILGYIGRFHTMGIEKGIPELIHAMGELKVSSPDLRPLLLLVGGPMDRVPAYLELAHHIGVSPDDIHFVDRVHTDEVPRWIRACDVVTICWPWTRFSAYYTSPLKLFEYMASGTPIVASNLPSLREILEDEVNALLVRSGDPWAIADGARRLFENPGLADRLAAQAKRDVTAYTWEKRAERILAFVRSRDKRQHGVLGR